MTHFKAGVKNSSAPAFNKGARDPANFKKGEAQQKLSPVVNTGAKAPKKFMKAK